MTSDQPSRQASQPLDEAQSPPAYIVTGGAGFIGSNLCAELIRREPAARVVVVDDCSSGSFENLMLAHERAGIAPFSGEFHAIASFEADWAWLIGDVRPSAIFHLGAQTDTTIADERAMIERNVTGFSDLLEITHAAGVPMMYASSAATYGSPGIALDRKPFEEHHAGRPNNVYGFSKWLMECEHRRFAQRVMTEAGTTPRVVGLRYFNVFGPGEGFKGKMASMVYQLASRLLEGERPRLFRDGEQARDQVFVDDVVTCSLAAVGIGTGQTPVPGVYNCGSGVATSFNTIAQTLRHALGIAAGSQEIEYFDMPESVRAFYQDFTQADLTQTTTALGWSPATSPQAGIAAYARWLSQRCPARQRAGVG